MCRRRFNIRKYFTVIHNINKLKESKTTWSSHLMLKISSAKSSNASKIVLFKQKFFRKRCTLTNWGNIAGNSAWRRFDQVIPLSSNFTWSLKYIVMFSDLGWCCRYCNTEKEKKDVLERERTSVKCETWGPEFFHQPPSQVFQNH